MLSLLGGLIGIVLGLALAGAEPAVDPVRPSAAVIMLCRWLLAPIGSCSASSRRCAAPGSTRSRRCATSDQDYARGRTSSAGAFERTLEIDGLEPRGPVDQRLPIGLGGLTARRKNAAAVGWNEPHPALPASVVTLISPDLGPIDDIAGCHERLARVYPLHALIVVQVTGRRLRSPRHEGQASVCPIGGSPQVRAAYVEVYAAYVEARAADTQASPTEPQASAAGSQVSAASAQGGAPYVEAGEPYGKVSAPRAQGRAPHIEGRSSCVQDVATGQARGGPGPATLGSGTAPARARGRGHHSAKSERSLGATLRLLASTYAPDAALPRAVARAWLAGRGDKTLTLALAWARENVRLALEEVLERSPHQGTLPGGADTRAWLLLAACEAIAHEPPAAGADRLRALLELTGQEPDLL